MSLTRRKFVEQSLAATAAGWSLVPGTTPAEQDVGLDAKDLRLAPFRFDVTPPLGHSLCGGWIKPAVDVDDPLEAIGFVLLGAGEPIVVCAVDWTGLLNGAHVQWRQALAQAAGTTADRVAVQCVHQHNAPLACLDAEHLVKQQDDLPHVIDLDFYRRCLARGRQAVQQSLGAARVVTHVAYGQGKVEKVASNRRVFRSDDGHVKTMRGSSCRDEALRALPEGLIDPWLKTVAFYDKSSKIAACHYYATHPMSYYGDGRVSSDFAGLARKQRQRDDPDCLHLYFSGCAGNIAAGKYNDGAKEMRAILTQRMVDGMMSSEDTLKPVPVERVGWRTVKVLPPPRTDLSADALHEQIADRSNSLANRIRPAFILSWLRRLEQQTPVVLSALRINDVALLHLPAECFVEYQLRAQQMQPSRFIATAAYGDGGPWYIPVAEEYPNGGYEVSVAFCDPQIDPMLGKAVASLLA
jgi:hypothetical protein